MTKIASTVTDLKEVLSYHNLLVLVVADDNSVVGLYS